MMRRSQPPLAAGPCRLFSTASSTHLIEFHGRDSDLGKPLLTFARTPLPHAITPMMLHILVPASGLQSMQNQSKLAHAISACVVKDLILNHFPRGNVFLIPAREDSSDLT